ncbi:MAG: 30S ribosomal protein S20 [Planctomycetota bacterium]|nr:30S ribosomal protein S20 [Planctomycetota bacterium]
MAHSLSAQKRVRQAEKRTAYNRWRTRLLRQALRELSEKLLHAPYNDCVEPFRKACALLDRTAQKGVIHRNTASRTKSRLARRMKVKNLGGASAPAKN